MSNAAFYEWLSQFETELNGFEYQPLDVLISRVERGEILENDAYSLQELFDE